MTYLVKHANIYIYIYIYIYITTERKDLPCVLCTPLNKSLKFSGAMLLKALNIITHV